MDDELREAVIEEWRRAWARGPREAIAARLLEIADWALPARADLPSFGAGLEQGLLVAVLFPEWARVIAHKLDPDMMAARALWGVIVGLMPVEEVTEEQTG